MSSSMVIGEIMIMNMIPFFILVRVLEIQRVRRELQGHSGGLESRRTVKRPFQRLLNFTRSSSTSATLCYSEENVL